MKHADLTLEWMSGRYAVCQLPAQARLPDWLKLRGDDASARLLSVTRTEREWSIVVDESQLPESIDADLPLQRGFAAIRIVGTLDFALVGVLSRLTAALAAANVSVFVISTYDTDILLVQHSDRENAEIALRTVAHFAHSTC